ncbi:MAG TPA: hypothetical protein VFP50_07880 [Anaeromyxobacteraceae bacterium]|nr:hypothetical protein [Anaeromyxobacteraceae bacterium]
MLLLFIGESIAFNLAAAETSPPPDAAIQSAWRDVRILGALGYGVLYVACGWRSGTRWRGCRAYLAAFAAYAALWWARMASVDFPRQASLHGILYALVESRSDIAYVVVLVAYCAVLIRGIARPGAG